MKTAVSDRQLQNVTAFTCVLDWPPASWVREGREGATSSTIVEVGPAPSGVLIQHLQVCKITLTSLSVEYTLAGSPVLAVCRG